MKIAKKAERPSASSVGAALSRQLGSALKARGMMLATAESCTGGGIAQALTRIPGCSAWFDRGFVTYSNQSKEEMLGVSPEVLDTRGAVSEETVREMAIGALQYSSAQVSVAVSGIAGPGGGTQEKPVGTVCFAWAVNHEVVRTACHRFSGDRDIVRAKSVLVALQGLVEVLAER